VKEFVFDESIIYPKDPTATYNRIKHYKEYYKVKYDICKAQAPKKIVEIGVRAGYSAWSFLQAAPDAKYIGLDASTGKHGGEGGEDGSYFQWAAEILSLYDCEFYDINTQKTDSLIFDNVDLFHVDGDHTTKGVMHDLDLALTCISEDGLILVDDITYLNNVKVGVDEWLKLHENGVNHEFLSSLRGEMLIRKK